MLVISENPLQERSLVQYMEMQHDAIDKPALPSYYTEVDMFIQYRKSIVIPEVPAIEGY